MDLPSDLGIVALEDGVSRSVPVMHTAAEAVAPLLAVGADAGFRPGAVAERLEALIPDLPEIVSVNVALGEAVAVDVGAGADAAVVEDGCDVDAGVTEVADVADLLFVATQVAFAGEGDVHRTGDLPLRLDEFH